MLQCGEPLWALARRAATVTAATEPGRPLLGPGYRRQRTQPRRKAAYAAHMPRPTNQIRLHHGIDRPRNVQSMSPQLPVAVMTLRTTSQVDIVSRMNDSGAPHDTAPCGCIWTQT